MSDSLGVVFITVFLIVLSAFFVIVEFSLLSARRHRLEEEAATKRSARSALKGINELTMMLAGAQLGITAVTFALGAITKPAVDAWLSPTLVSWGMPSQVAGGTAFALSLLFVTFLHLVIGEMAPKSWAIAHPETSAKLIGTASRAYIWPLRSLLNWINSIANRLVARSGVTPVDRASVGGQDAETISHLVEQSALVGTLDTSFRSQVSGVLELEKLTIESLMSESGKLTAVAPAGTVADVQEATARTGHLRVLVADSRGGAPGVIHARDTLLEPKNRSAESLSRPAFTLEADTTVYEALTQIRNASEQLAAVMKDGRFVGVITLSDVLRRVLPSERTAGAKR